MAVTFMNVHLSLREYWEHIGLNSHKLADRFYKLFPYTTDKNWPDHKTCQGGLCKQPQTSIQVYPPHATVQHESGRDCDTPMSGSRLLPPCGFASSTVSGQGETERARHEQIWTPSLAVGHTAATLSLYPWASVTAVHSAAKEAGKWALEEGVESVLQGSYCCHDSTDCCVCGILINKLMLDGS
jgi:hypothetical protein